MPDETTLLVTFGLVIMVFVFVLAATGPTSRFLTTLLVAEITAQVVKRAIFLAGPQAQITYYIAQCAPIVLEFLAIASVFGSPPKNSKAIKFFLAFNAVGLLLTILSPSSGSLTSRAEALVQVILPGVIFFVGLKVTSGSLRKAAKCYAILAIISVLYGIIQFALGPSFLDRVWAENTVDFSIQAQRIMPVLQGVSRDFRPSSFYADPLTWGLFAIAALSVISAAWSLKLIDKGLYVAGAGSCLLATILTRSRSTLGGALAVVAFYFLLRLRYLRSPLVLGAIFVGAFFVTDYLSNYFVSEYGSETEDTGDLSSRYSDVGTLGVRTHSLQILSDLGAGGIVGKGYGYSIGSLARDASADVSVEIADSHSLVVQTIVNVGYVGLAFLAGFLYLVIRDGSALCRGFTGRDNTFRWLLAGILATFFVGLVSGPGVLTFHFYLIAGMISAGLGEGGEFRQRRMRRSVPVPVANELEPAIL